MGPPPSHPPPATVPVPAPHRQPAVAPPPLLREEALPGTPAPDNGRPPYRGAFCEGWATRPPAALIDLGRWPRLGSQHPPPCPPPWHPPLRPRGRPLGSVPPLSFLKFKIHLSQEEGKLLPLKPLALSGKSSLPCRCRLLAPGDSREGGARLPLPASLRAGRQWGALCAPLQHDQCGVRLPPNPPASPSRQEHPCCSLAADLDQEGGSPHAIDAPTVWQPPVTTHPAGFEADGAGARRVFI